MQTGDRSSVESEAAAAGVDSLRVHGGGVGSVAEILVEPIDGPSARAHIAIEGFARVGIVPG
jgi:hypothetical protein